MSQPPTKAGWLRKQSGFFKSWKLHWFTLRDKTVTYSQKPTSKNPRTIRLESARTISPAPECRRQPAFKISIPNVRTYYLVAETPADVSDWVTVLDNARNLMLSPPKPKRTGIDDFDIVRLIGRGTYGAVQLVRHRSTGQLFAMKTMNKQTLADYQQIEQTLMERNVLLQTIHPFLVGAHFTFQTDASIFLVLDYVPGGELFGRLKEEKTFSEPRSRLYAAEILLGLGHLHSHGLVYRDLKPENILVDAEGHLKLTDFGLVKSLSGGSGTTTTFCGTPEYLAPEMLRQIPYNKSVDWWSFGCILFEMIAGLPPFYDENKNKMYRAIMGDEIRFPDDMSGEARDLICKLLDRNPRRRLGGGERDYAEIQEHPFFAVLDWVAVENREVQPEWKPVLTNETDVSNFDEQFTSQAVPSFHDPQIIADGSTQAAFNGFTAVNASRL